MMIDFLMISVRNSRRGPTEIYPKFIIKKSSDLMIRGGDFYAIWLEDRGLWSTDEQDALQLIDKELDRYAEENRTKFETKARVLHMWDAESGMIDCWHKYCQRQMRDSFHMLDEYLQFSNSETKKKDYASKRLSYAIGPGECQAYDKIVSTLYSPDERHKIEWAIGAIVSGASKTLQKFVVLYGASGSGKSTVLNIIQALFEGYYSVFDARALGSSNNSFALESFKANPLVAIQHDGDLSRIEDNTRLNSLVSHELMTVNEKFKSAYASQFKSFLFMGTNKPVKITDAKSGLIRRLIDVSPSGNLLGPREYKTCVKQTAFELGAIAYHCQEVYSENPGKYDDYVPVAMLGASNDFYNFISDSYFIFEKESGTTLKAAWEMYKTYCDEAKVNFPMSQRVFKEELKNYFKEYKERFTLNDGTRVRNYYSEFLTDKFETKDLDEDVEVSEPSNNMPISKTKSILDDVCADCKAQYANSAETPAKKWSEVNTKLSDLDTSKLHYVQLPASYIVVDFDIPDESGNKCFEENLKEASKWPPTYAELSKGGEGIHLHYIYDGDTSKLSPDFAKHIEIKTFAGNSALRRRLSKCNDLPIAHISSGLPLKGEKMVSFDSVKSEKSLRTQIKRNLEKEIHSGTKPSIDFIYKILDDAYKSGLHYDVTDMHNSILTFAAKSTHQADYCIKLVNKMHFKSEESSNDMCNDANLIFYDVEVFPNLFIINWKKRGKDNKVVRMINPSSTDVEELLHHRLVGFNCRRYDNHILYARLIGYTNEQLYILSQKIISGDRNCFFGEAYNLSYTDIFDFAAAGHKQSLKKFEIELGIHHHELGLPWDKPVPEELWTKVAEYCDDDVLATEATFDYLADDWTAREILADVAGMTVNDTTNTLTTRIIFGKNRHPQDQFNYRFMGDIPSDIYHYNKNGKLVFYKHNDGNYAPVTNEDFSIFDKDGKPIFPGYRFERGKSFYRGEEVGEGGEVYSEPGMYGNVALLDIASMHPHSTISENLFGSEYTARYKEIVDARVYIKHEDYESAKKVLNGALAKYLTDKEHASALSTALKTPINSIYGLTSAHFDNPAHDPRNIDNIVAKRGALFMINLEHEVQAQGFTVAHIKTDSIKIPDATPEIIKFVMDYGKLYGYTFEHEATYDKFCIVNKAVYIAKYDSMGIRNKGGKHANDWTATGTQFAVPYVFKKLFSKKKIELSDLCETKSVTSALYLDMNEDLPDVSKVESEIDKIMKDIRKMSDQKDIDVAIAKIEQLNPEVSKGHDYHFIGKVGSFCPIKPGCGGGLLLRETTTKIGGRGYASATDAKDYRWLEAEMVEELNKSADIDLGYYDGLVDAAIKEIHQYGEVDWFASDEPYDINLNGIHPF